MAVLRYYLNYSNDEDLARGLLILFLPFEDEMTDIHQKDVNSLLAEFRTKIEEKRQIFEKYKNLTDLISSIETKKEINDELFDEPEEESIEIETTDDFQIEHFKRWAKSQAAKDLKEFKSLTTVCDVNELRSRICSLNCQQRELFDDIVERFSSFDDEQNPFYLFLSGNTGTGKSYLLRLIIDAVKVLMIKGGSEELTKPPLIVMAPTATAAYIIGGKTIDSVLGFLPADNNKYSKASEAKMANMAHTFEEVSLIVVDEISMVGPFLICVII